MFEIRQVRELKTRKAFLVGECALDRSLIAAETAVFEQKTRWPALLFSGAMAALPKLQFLLPVAGWVIARGLGRFGRGTRAPVARGGINIVGLVRKGVVAWQLFKRGRQLWSQWREQRGIRRFKPLA